MAARRNSAAAQRIDLLTTVMHEMGHVLGYEHSSSVNDLMAATLSPGERRTLAGTPSLAAWEFGSAWDDQPTNTSLLDQVFASFHDHGKRKRA